ncbi:GMC oxidoreductase [Streptomyces sp. NPDC013978]|uniref:GMC oxidoreductase n=1 Tax=Streptomyces sp. NPDC013978 TaxID=3364869 RepID=UPI0037025201
MFTVVFETQRAAPGHVVSLRTSKDWNADIPGWFSDGEWVFTLDEREYRDRLECKLVLDRATWMAGPNRVVVPATGEGRRFTDAEVDFPAEGRVVTESGRVQRTLVRPDYDENHVYDVIVVGSGFGGGVLADQLGDRGADVLVLEMGSYLFPTHVANLPRRLRTGVFDKHVWGLWQDFRTVNYTNGPGSDFQGAQGFNLGGRSIFWGGLIPAMGAWELVGWPSVIRDHLLDTGYRRARDALSRTIPVASAYQEETKRLMTAALPDFEHLDAPVAVQYQGHTSASMPGGMFSTADLLLESLLVQDDTPPPGRITVNLNHAVVEVLTDGDRTATGVRCFDLLNWRERRYKGRNIVLAAGTIESAKLALRSQLKDPNQLIGRGITDHPILYTHFSLPFSSPHAVPASSAKVLSRHSGASVSDHPYNAVLELGADFNQGRYVDPDNLAQHRKDKADSVLCELVFLLHTDLQNDNRVELGRSANDPVTVHVRPAPVTPTVRAQLEQVKQVVFDAFGAQPVGFEDLSLKTASLGGVAHEVGTLRVGGVVDSDLRFLDYDNLYACDNSVFPTSPAANPSLTLAALALRLAEHLTPVV